MMGQRFINKTNNVFRVSQIDISSWTTLAMFINSSTFCRVKWLIEVTLVRLLWKVMQGFGVRFELVESFIISVFVQLK